MNQTQKQHIENRIDQKIKALVASFDEQNPKPESLETWRILEVATKDPQWLKKIVKQSKAGTSWDCHNQILRDSPKAKAFHKQHNSKSERIDNNRKTLVGLLNEKKLQIMDKVMIEGLSGQELIKVIENF